MTTVEKIELALGQDKLRVIGVMIDQLKDEVARLSRLESADDQAETFELDWLVAKYGGDGGLLRKKANEALGERYLSESERRGS